MTANIRSYPRHTCAEVSVEVSTHASSRHTGMWCRDSLFVKNRKKGGFVFICLGEMKAVLSLESHRDMSIQMLYNQDG